MPDEDESGREARLPPRLPLGGGEIDVSDWNFRMCTLEGCYAWGRLFTSWTAWGMDEIQAGHSYFTHFPKCRIAS